MGINPCTLGTVPTSVRAPVVVFAAQCGFFSLPWLVESPSVGDIFPSKHLSLATQEKIYDEFVEAPGGSSKLEMEMEISTPNAGVSHK
jgi:hypothetical protein